MTTYPEPVYDDPDCSCGEGRNPLHVFVWEPRVRVIIALHQKADAKRIIEGLAEPTEKANDNADH